MSRNKPHTIALRLTPDEYEGLLYFVEQQGYDSLTAALRQLVPVDQLARYGRKRIEQANNG